MSPPTNAPCAICGKPIKDNECFAVPVSAGGGYRHKRCGPGSKVWLAKYPESATSEISQLLTKNNGKSVKTANSVDTDGIPKVIKPSLRKDPNFRAARAMAGRIKYLLFMNTLDKQELYFSLTDMANNLRTDGVVVYTYLGNTILCNVYPIETLQERLYESICITR